MKNHTFIRVVLGAALLSTTLAACGDSGSDDTGTNTNQTTNPTNDTEPPVTTTNDGSTTVVDPTVVDPTTTSVDPTTTTVDPTTTTVDPTTTTGDDNGFVFADDPYEAYTQNDRHGAVEAGTAGIGAKEGLGLMPNQDVSIRDGYNKSNPVEDAAGKWIPEIAKSVMFFHAALDDDLMAAKLTPATFDQSVAQAGPVIVPDTIKYDPAMPTAYPNGRKLEDQVVDITLAAVLLDLKVHPLDVLAKLPLNPPKNDVAFKAEFPFLAPPHPPKP